MIWQSRCSLGLIVDLTKVTRLLIEDQLIIYFARIADPIQHACLSLSYSCAKGETDKAGLNKDARPIK